MSLIRVKNYFDDQGLVDRILIFDQSSATVTEAANALNCKEKEIAKTLSFLVNDQAILIVMAGDTKVDNAKFKETFKVKANMIPKDQVESFIGHDVGGVCPFAIKDNVLVYLDISLKRFTYVYPACGSSNSAIKLTINELEQYSNYQSWIDVGK